jgi:hypothetical protein
MVSEGVTPVRSRRNELCIELGGLNLQQVGTLTALFSMHRRTGGFFTKAIQLFAFRHLVEFNLALAYVALALARNVLVDL